MPEPVYIHESPEPRILVISQRLIESSISRCTIFEFEDRICDFDAADLVAPSASMRTVVSRHLDKAMIRVRGRVATMIRRQPIPKRRYDAVVVSCEDLGDLPRLGPLYRWLDAGRLKICYVEELWDVDIPRRSTEIGLLREFDLIFLSCAGAVDRLASATGRPCAYLPPAVDAVRSCPYPNPPERVIDIYNMGRRSVGTHAAFQDVAAQRDLFYLYDTFTGNRTIDPRDHRRLLADLIRRSRYFVANRAKIDHPELTERQEELGARHFEGAAGGAVVIGDPPQCATFAEHLGWPDAVVPLPFDATAEQNLTLFDGLDADPERVARIRANNVRHCLQRHDWVYRWSQILEAAGMDPQPAVAARLQKLTELAGMVPQAD